jgi:hypothetical protein
MKNTLTKKQKKQFEHLQYHLQRAAKFLKSSSTYVCVDILPNALSFYNKEGKGLNPINKEMGSDLCGLFMALAEVNRILAADIVARHNVPVTEIN